MTVVPITKLSIADLVALMSQGRPWLPESSDYWFFQAFCGSTSFAAFADGVAAGGIIACRNPDIPNEIYVDQVAVHRMHRGRGVVEALFAALERRASQLHCKRIWLSTDPNNPAMRVWPRLGFRELGVRRDFKGPGKDRAIFEKRLAP